MASRSVNAARLREVATMLKALAEELQGRPGVSKRAVDALSIVQSVGSDLAQPLPLEVALRRLIE